MKNPNIGICTCVPDQHLLQLVADSTELRAFWSSHGSISTSDISNGHASAWEALLVRLLIDSILQNISVYLFGSAYELVDKKNVSQRLMGKGNFRLIEARYKLCNYSGFAPVPRRGIYVSLSSEGWVKPTCHCTLFSRLNGKMARKTKFSATDISKTYVTQPVCNGSPMSFISSTTN